ncbi:MAG: zinc-binding dehydrogenase [bacterium]|nr:zinc-binding dehydrogenase [bacterium]MCP5067001.1 zinc-binding dehydrogenase [bacterium]
MPGALQLQSTIKADATLEVALAEVDVPAPGPDDVLVRVEAAPINPSDLGLLFGPAEIAAATVSGDPDRPILRAKVPAGLMPGLAARVDQAMPVGNEGAGVVVEAGSSELAESLLGRTVALVGGSMYAQMRCVPAAFCLALPEGTTPAEGASCFVNPLTALGMVETMKLENHTALVHSAAASNLGQMLNKICQADGISLVNIVRKPAQVDLLRGLGAKHICNSSEDSFMSDLTEALVETGATLAFDAIGGGRLASQILTCMERAANRTATEYSRYGSTIHKQVYLYGSLDTSLTELNRNYGAAWGIAGWLLPPFLQRIGPAKGQELRERVAREIKTTFASHYTREVSLAEALQLEVVRVYGRQATGEKVLINPNKRI